MEKQFLNHLTNPPKEYRPIPFWSWNEKLEIDETRWQIDQMDKVGIGGYFMHARGGLQTQYMGEEWMENIQVGISEGISRNMGAWGYDENGWPSGFGSGIVNGMGIKYQQKYLRYEILKECDRTEHTIAILPYNGRSIHVYYDVNPFYVDTLDGEVTREFLNNIHEKYKKDLGDKFQSMAGFFTDEPQVSRNGIPWSFILPYEYEKRYGEELIPLLPCLFLETGNWTEVRYRFWSLVRDLFADNYMKQIYDWCNENKIGLTGHMVLEETMHSQLVSNGACMPNYEFMHIPGIDWLTRSLAVTTTPMQASSVAHQLGKKQVLSETFALSGWDVSFEELKWMYEAQMVRGVNLLCQHLEGYSLRGIRKRDYPPSLFYQQPWWGEYKQFNDAMSRIGMLLAEGEVSFDVLLLHPQSSAWICYDDGKNEGIDDLDQKFLALATVLEDHQIPYHLGDERIIERHGTIKGDKFSVGSQNYSVVIVPPSTNISSNNLRLLKEFKENGGIIIWMDMIPYMVDGNASEEVKFLVKGCIQTSLEEVASCIPASVKKVRVQAKNGCAKGIAMTYRRFQDQGFTMVYLVNSKLEPQEVNVIIRGSSAQQLDIMTGQVVDVYYTENQGLLSVSHYIEAMGSLVLFVYDEKKATVTKQEEKYNPINPLFKGKWELVECDENALVLDYCDYYFDGKLMGKQVHINNIQEEACALNGPVEIILEFNFTVKEKPQRDLFLVMETPEKYDIYINSQKVENISKGYYRDKSFIKIDISKYVTVGKQEIKLVTQFGQTEEIYQNIKNSLAFESEKNKLTYQDEIEAIYIVGDFGVETLGEFKQLDRRAVYYKDDFSIITRPNFLTEGNFVEQGFAFFNGRMVLKQSVMLTADELEARSIKFSKRCSTVTKVIVNGKDAGTVLWRPYEVKLDSLLREGKNTIEIEIIGNLRNLLGPHHTKDGESYVVGPFLFYEKSPIWSGGINHNWDDGYCFVEYGLFLS